MVAIDELGVPETAFAKINLTLHVLGQRPDGYHIMDSLVAFANVGDRVYVSKKAKALSLNITGPFSNGLSAGADNLVMRAARAFGSDNTVTITLEKNLPVASGIGGGSADAAATLRLLARRWRLDLPDAETILELGADVPVCMSHDLTRMRGIGDDITRLCPMPELPMVLVNPGVAVSTAEVFGRLARKDNPAPEGAMPDPYDTPAWIDWLSRQRNDLEPPARAAYPVISDAINDLAEHDGCLLARMSGSGATCFGLFKDVDTAVAARDAITKLRPDWWVQYSAEAGNAI